MTDSTFSREGRPTVSATTWVILAVAALLVAGWLMFLRPRILLQQATDRPGVGRPLPVLELQPLTGTSDGVSLENVRGRVVLINFWGPWCGFCIQEFPHLFELWDRYRGNAEFAFLSVSSDGSLHDDVPALKADTEDFLKSRGATFPTYVDADGVSRRMLADAMGAQAVGYPTTVLLDRGGIIRAIWVGYRSGDERSVEQMVSKLLAEKDAAVPRAMQ